MTKTELLTLKEKLVTAANAYYNTQEVIMTDEEFDELKTIYETESGESFQVGAIPNVDNVLNVSHTYKNLAGTLAKVNTLDEFYEWIKKTKLSKSDLALSWKLDGHSIIFEFENNKLVKALTRGNNGLGKDLTSYFKSIHKNFFTKNKVLTDLSFQLDDDTSVEITDFAIAFEAVISWENLAKLNEEFNTDFKNPRSTINGILSKDGFKYAKYLTLIPLKFRLKDHTLPRSIELSIIDELVISTSSKVDIFKSFDIENDLRLKDIDVRYDTYSNTRSTYPFMVDGLVIESTNDDEIERLGYSSTHPNFAIAFKFPYMEKTTTLKKVFWSTEGNSAIYTPMALIEDVQLNGATYNTVSLANFSRFKSLNLRKGDKMIFQLRNDVLGWVDKIGDTTDTKAKLFNEPTECEYCGHELHNDGVFIKCINHECALVKVGNIQNFIDKIGIKNIKRNIIDALYSESILLDIEGIFSLNPDDIASIEGFGESSAFNIINSINERFEQPVYDYEVLGSLNIDNVSLSRARSILTNYSMNTLIDLSSNRSKFINEISSISGIGKEIANSLYDTMSNSDSLKLIQNLIHTLSNISTYKEIKDSIIKSDTQFNFVVTGDLNYSSRDELKDKLILNGHKLSSSVSSKTSYLVTNDTSSGTVKNKKAMELNVPIINEDQLYELLGFKTPSKYSNGFTPEELFD